MSFDHILTILHSVSCLKLNWKMVDLIKNTLVKHRKYKISKNKIKKTFQLKSSPCSFKAILWCLLYWKLACVGSFGINCSGRCPERFFGYGCLSRCNCSEDQICDSRDGCMADRIRQYEGIINVIKVLYV